MKNSFLPQNAVQKVALIVFLLITSTIFHAQDKTYAYNQEEYRNGLCLGCYIEDPLKAVGSNENDFASIKIAAGLGGTIGQTLIFPAATNKPFRKIVIGIGRPGGITIQALGEIRVESYLGDTANGDNIQVDSSMLKIGQDPQKATIEFTPTKFFDRIKISLHGGLIAVNNTLQVYYAYHTPTKFTTCGNPPLDPLHYYPFNGNGKDIISNFDLDADGGIDFNQKDVVCRGAVYGNLESTLDHFRNSEDPDPNYKTIAFWVKKDSTPAGYIKPEFKIETFHSDNTSQLDYAVLPEELTHITIVYDKQNFTYCYYKNGVKPLHSSCWVGVNPFRGIHIELTKTKIDEFLVYDRVLTSDEIKALACSYGRLTNCTSGTSAPVSKIATPTETFTVSPNPTTGEITLDGSILLVGSDISIRNTSGTEVYHSAFRSKTFELPATLPGGVYILTLQTKDKKVYTRKIILTR